MYLPQIVAPNLSAHEIFNVLSSLIWKMFLLLGLGNLCLKKKMQVLSLFQNKDNSEFFVSLKKRKIFKFAEKVFDKPHFYQILMNEFFLL